MMVCEILAGKNKIDLKAIDRICVITRHTDKYIALIVTDWQMDREMDGCYQVHYIPHFVVDNNP